MTLEDKNKRLLELENLEEIYKSERNFINLISVYNESLQLFDSTVNIYDKLPKKIYCLTRLGRIMEASFEFTEFKDHLWSLDSETLERVEQIIYIFSRIQRFGLNDNDRKIIIKWLTDSKSSELMSNIIFDYKDFLGPLKLFDSNRLNHYNTEFSDDLLECIFLSMARNFEEFIFYNKELNTVERLYRKRLINVMETDYKGMYNGYDNVYKQILSDDEKELIIDGIHYLIPRLKVHNFIGRLIYSQYHNDLIDRYCSHYFSYLNNLFEEESDEPYNITFRSKEGMYFFENIQNWFKHRKRNPQQIYDCVNDIKKQVALEFLKEVNSQSKY
jgi:hypothetical protein